MRESIASLRLVVGMAFRADPWRAAVIVLPTQALWVGVLSWASREIVDGAITGDRGRFWLGIGVSLAGGLAGISLALLSFSFDMRLREKLGVLVDERLIRTVGDIPTVAHHDLPDVADKLELLRVQRHELLSGVGALSNVLNVIATILVSAGLLATVDPIAGFLPVFGLPLIVLSRRAVALQQAVTDATAERQREALHLYDLATAPDAAKELRVFGLEGEFRRRYHDAWSDVAATRLRADVRAAVLIGVGGLCLTVGFAGVLWLIAQRARDGRTTPGDLALVIGILATLSEQIRFLSSLGGWVTGITVTAGRLRTIERHAADARAASRWSAEPIKPPDRLENGIVLDAVSFTYPGATAATLTDVSLVLPAGSSIVIVGDNGAGKSTLVSLLCGFHLPSSGEIRVDDVPLDRIPPTEWRSRLAAGFQDHANFELVAHETVGIGDLDALGDRATARDALVRASAGDVIDALDDGLETSLGASLDGRDLSGGQWQKLALGRAMMREGPLLLVLDEPTSAIDAEAEHRLFERYAAAAAQGAEATGTITLFVSHRFSTVRAADLIVVIDDARVVEFGSHEALMAKPALYAELFELQAAAYR